MFLNDIDSQFIKSLHYLYSSDLSLKGDNVPLQFYLEEAIKNKMGLTKDLSPIVAASFKQRGLLDFKPFLNSLEESKGSSSDNELELDLLKEDLMCIICNGMDVGARNRLLECSDCHMLYHQECHKPIVTNQDSFDTWICQNCKPPVEPQAHCSNEDTPTLSDRAERKRKQPGVMYYTQSFTVIDAEFRDDAMLLTIQNKSASKKMLLTCSLPPVTPTSELKVSDITILPAPSAKPTSSSSSHRHFNNAGTNIYKSKSDKYSKSSTSSSSTSKPSSSFSHNRLKLQKGEVSYNLSSGSTRR